LSFKILYSKIGALFFLSTIALFLAGCGEATVEVTNVSYEPRIVVEGYLVPGQPVRDIRISRNFPLDADLRPSADLLPRYTQTKVVLTDESSGLKYPLTLSVPDSIFDFENYTYGYQGNDLRIEHGKTYTLDVQTVIDGQVLEARSSTTVPEVGFRINSINHSSLQFAQTDEDGETMIFEMEIQRSPGTTFYVTSVRPLQTDFGSFIIEHLVGDLDPEDYEENFEEFAFDTNWIQNTPSTPGESNVPIFWFSFFFYSEYEVIVYAADKNYKGFLQTFANTQEFDGNFHEARFNFEGDAIGVFGSVIADTIYVDVTR